MQGSFRESSSPFTLRYRRYDHTPLYINNNDSEMVNDRHGTSEDLHKDTINGSEDSKKQIAMVRPQNMHNSTDSLNDEISKNFFYN